MVAEVLSAQAAAGKAGDVLQTLEALDAKQVLSAWRGSAGGVKLCLSLANGGFSEEAETAKQHLSRLGMYSAPTSSFMTLLAENKLTEAVDAFLEASKETGKMTGKYVVMRSLIEAEDMENMQRVLDASIATYGEERSLYDLADDFLHLGRLKQARKLLATPGLRYNQKKVEHILFGIKDPKVLEQFVAFMKPVFACNRDYLFERLATVLKNDTARLEEVWLTMEEEGHVPSEAIREIYRDAFERAGETPKFNIGGGH